VTTPAPPTTPPSEVVFECRNEGFFPDPATCKKYFWCLDTPSQGMVAHTFSCPQGLYFNQITDGCDFLRNVDCGDKDISEPEPKEKKNEVKENSITDSEEDDDDIEDPNSLKAILERVKAAGGVEGLEKQIEEKEAAKKEEEDRRVRISSKTRSRLSQLLNRGQSPKPQRGGDSKDPALVSRSKISNPRLTTKSSSLSRSSSNSRSDASRNSLLSRLASKRRNLSPRLQSRVKPNFTREDLSTEDLENSSSEEDSLTTPTQTPKRTTTARSFSRKTSLFRNRSRFSSSREATPRSSSKSTSRPIRTRAPLLRTRFRNVLSRTSPAPTTTTTSPPTDPFYEESFTTLNPENDPEDESNKKIMIVGAHLEPEEPEEQALHLGVFKPKAGIREKLRETLHTVLEHEMAERGDHREEEEPSTIAPLSTVTISRNTRIKDASQRERSKSFVGRQRKLPSKSNKVSPGSNRYVTIQRDSGTTPTPDIIDDSINQSSKGGEDVNIDEASTPFQPTVSDNLISTDASTQAPFFPTFVPVDSATEKSKTTSASIILITEAPQEQPRRDNPRRLEIFNLQNENELTDNKSSDPESVRLGTHSSDDKSISREQALFKDAQDNSRSSEVPQRSSRPFVGRPLRPVPSRNQDASSRQRSSSRHRSRSRSRAPNPVTSPKPTTRFETSFEPSEPEQLASPVQPSRVLSPEDLVQALAQSPSPDTRVASQQFSQPRRPEEASLGHRGRAQISVAQNTRNRDLAKPAAVALPVQPASDNEFEYEYYYDYLDDDHDKPNSDYDLVPLANKVRIQADGLPHCLDVGVFPHPFSCKKFVNCFRNPGTGIVGSIYQCPSYLAFDPVGGRCNWVNEIVCASRK